MQKIEKILLVEDEGLIANDLKRLIKRIGYDPVGIASSGSDAIELFKRLSPDLILMDIMLEGDINGITAAARINLISDVPIIFVTSHAEPDLVDKAIKENPYGYVLKPFKEYEIRYSIKLALQRADMIKKIKEKENELTYFKNFYNTILNSQSDWIAVVDRNSFITFANHTYQKAFNCNEEDYKDKRIKMNLFSPEAAFINDVFLTGTSNGCEQTITDAAGIERIYSINASPLFSNDIGVDSAVISGRDITSLIRQKESLSKMREVLNLIIEMAPIGIILTRADGTITMANRIFESMTGQDSMSLKWMKISDIIRTDISHIFKKASEELIDCSGSMDMEFKKTDGGHLLTKTLISCFQKPIDNDFKIIFFVTDISFEKKLERKQIKLQNHIETIMREMDDLSEMLLETNVYNESIKARQYSFDPTERHILKHIESGHNNGEIARRMGLAEITIKKRLTNIYSKLGIKNKYQLLEFIHTNFIPEK